MKPIVHYHPTPNDVIVVGQRASLYWVVDHLSPDVSNTEGVHVSTSTVLEMFDKGEFETRNTIYQPVKTI